ncbi:MAG: CoA pyrophosphatase [Sphingomicrobium sp.]
MTLAERLRAALSGPPPISLLGGDLDEPRVQSAVPAAVLIPITDREQPGVILTVRREHMRTHSGQIAFPGGRIDRDEDPTAAALREANEELLLDPQSADIVGSLDPYRTVTGYIVTAVVALIPPDPTLTPHEPEVAEWFEAPLAHLLDLAHQLRRTGLFAGKERHYYEILWNGRRIWGATAAIIVNLSRRLQWS